MALGMDSFRWLPVLMGKAGRPGGIGRPWLCARWCPPPVGVCGGDPALRGDSTPRDDVGSSCAEQVECSPVQPGCVVPKPRRGGGV